MNQDNQIILKIETLRSIIRSELASVLEEVLLTKELQDQASTQRTTHKGLMVRVLPSGRDKKNV